MNHPLPLRALFKVLPLALWFAMPAELKAVTALKIDLTVGSNLTTVDRTFTYNLGPTGMRGWIDNGWPETPAQDGYTAFAPYQILVTTVGAGTPAAGILAVDDVILGASAGSGAVPLFTSDTRKSLGLAIGAAEAGNGVLSFKRWRAGVTTDVSIDITPADGIDLGAYTETAPYNCPKTTRIMNRAASRLAQRITTYGWGKDGPGSINALALLATGDPAYLPMLQTYARSLAPATLNLEASVISAWQCYESIFLAEYYMVTKDAQVFHGLSEYVKYAATHQSMYGTAGHGFSNVAPPGGWQAGGPHGSISWYGPVNSAGLIAQISVALGKKAGVVSAEIDPAIERAAKFFGYYVNRGSIPYGEHEPYCGDYQILGQNRTYYDHRSNGKDGMAAVMFGCMDNKPAQLEYYSRMALAGHNGEAYGHTGQGFSYIWTMLGANMGGPLAVQEYHKKMRWDRDMKRRSDGSFVYEGGEQWAPGKASSYFEEADPHIYYDNPTAYYLLHAAIPLKTLYITGKGSLPANDLDATKVSNALWAADFTAACGGYSKAQLFAALGEWDPIVRMNAATELATRSLTPTELNDLIVMAEHPTDANQREAASTALGCLQATSAIPALTRRLKDSNNWVRAKAAKALGKMGASAASSVPDMLDAFVTNVTATYPFEAGFNWDDPLQVANGWLASSLFYSSESVADFTINADKSLLYPAVRAGIKHPTGSWRGRLGDFVANRLTEEDVKALALDLFEEVKVEGPCDRMFTMAGPHMAMSALSKYHIAEGIDLCMGKTSFWGWDGAAAFDLLSTYDEAARRKLPDLQSQNLAWMSALDPPGGENATNLDNAIDRIDRASTAPVLTYGMPLASPQIGVAPANTARAITLTGSSCRQAAVIYQLATQPAHGTLTGTPPNLTYTPAAGYQGMDRFTFTVTDNLTTSTPGTVNLIVGNGGTGLTGSYYDNLDFTAPKVTRIDPSINFDWGSAPPDNTMGAGTYSVRWTGQVLAPESGTYRFSTRTSDGVRLWINGVQVINDWNDQATSLWNDSAAITLAAGQKYTLKMEYYNNANAATARLYWYMPSRSEQTIIPQELLFPASGVSLTSPTSGASFGPAATITLTADAADVAGTVTNVSFYQGGTLIGSDTIAPYSVVWSNVPVGEYSLTAKSTESTGAVTTSAVAVITVDGNTAPVTSGLACWYDASFGTDTDVNQGVKFWRDRSGNGHDAVYTLWDPPVLRQNEIFTRPAIRFSCGAGASYLDVAGPMFVKEQYIVVRNPLSNSWNYGTFLGRASGRASSYLMDGTAFYPDQYPAGVSKNGTALSSPFNLTNISNFMVLKITVNNGNTNPAAYQIGRGDGQSNKFDVAEILGYSRTLTTQEEAMVGGYLAAKYGLTTIYPATGSLANQSATGITTTAAALNATLMCNGGNYNVTAYWGTEDGGINPANWANSASIGSWNNVASINLSHAVTNLAPGTNYYFTFRGTSGATTIWATPARSFATTSTAKDLLSFGTNVAGSSTVIDTGAGTVAWTVPYGTNLTNLAPAYTVSPLAVGTPLSGISRNFSTPQTYTIVAEDFSTKDYTVTVTQGAASSASDILTFGPGAVINGTNILLTVPYETDLATLAPTYTVSPGASGTPASGVAPTPNFAFANPAVYTITGQDGITTKTYWVTISVLPFNPNRISNGSFEVGKEIPSSPGHTTVSLPSADLVGWNGNFDSWYVSALNWGFPAQDGSRVVNLCYDEGLNVVSQTFAVSAGTTYTVSCYNKQRGGGGRGLINLNVASGNVSGATQWGTAMSGSGTSTMRQVTTVDANWTRYGFTFTPNTTTSATLTLGNYYVAGNHGDNDGVFMDNVSVTAAATGGATSSTTTLARHAGTGAISTYGTVLSFDVTVAGSSGAPTGLVTLKDGGAAGTTLGSATLTSGTCTITTPSLAVGVHASIVAVYGGNSTYAGSISSPLSAQSVNMTAPNGLAATPGESGAITLTWNALAGATSYKVSIKNTVTNVTQVITATASPYTATGLTNNTSYEFKVAGTNSFGDGPYSAMVSATPILPPSTTTLASSLGAAGAYGSAVSFTATVAVTGGPATGTVTFRDGATVLGTATLDSGQTTLTSSTLAVGAHSITASYEGDTAFGGSSSSVFPYTVNAIPLTITGATASDKVYDGNTTANLTVGTLSAGVVGGETVTVIAGTGTFASANAGTWAVTASGYMLGGTHAGNYVLSAQPAVPNATISARPVVLAGTRIYDGTSLAAAGVLSVANNLDGGNLTLTGFANLDAKDVGARAVVSGTPIIRVQSATGTTGTAAATSLGVILGTAPTTGNTLVAVIATRGAATNQVSAISGGGVTWSRVSQAANANGTTTEIWYGPNVSSGTAGVTITQSSMRSAAVVLEYRGLLAPASFDVAANSTGNSAAASTGTTAATAQPYELCVGGIGLVNSGYYLGAPGNSFAAVATARTTHTTAANNSVVYALEKILTTGGTFSSGGTVSTSSQWSGAMATFKAVQAAPPPGVPVRVQTATGNTGGNASTTLGVTLGSTPVAGNTLVAVIATRGTSTGRVSGISGGGVTWTRVAQAANANGTTTEIWHGSVVSSGTTGVSITQTSLRSAAVVMEYSGLLTPASFDVAGNNTGNSAAADTGTTAATAQSIELCVGGIGMLNSGYYLGTPNDAFSSPGTARTTNTTAGNNSVVYALERILTTGGTANSGGTASTSSQWSGAIATFMVPALNLSGIAASNYTVTGATGTVMITPKALTVVGLTATNKAYDGSAAANLAGTAALLSSEAAGTGSTADGMPYTIDTPTLGGTATATFADPNVGIAKPVTVTGLTLTGRGSDNYTLSQPAGLTADIAPRSLTVTASSQSKTFGQTVAFGSGSTQFTSSGLQIGETIGSVTLACGGGGETAEVGSYPIAPSAATSGSFSAGNYSINYVPGTLTVNPAPLSPFATWASDPPQGLTTGLNDGPLDDPDHDGISNLLEFTLGGNPMQSSPAILPRLTKPAGDWLFEYERSALSKSSTTQVVEYGGDLTGWTPLTVPATTVGTVTITPGTTSDHVKVTLPALGASGFVRLKVTQM